MKKYVFSGLLLMAVGATTAQSLYIPGGSSGIATSPNGNIGIGNPSPQFKLEIGTSTNDQIAVGTMYLDFTHDDANNYVRGSFGSNVYWDAVNNLWKVRQIGANDFSAMIHPNGGGLAFVAGANTGNTALSLTNTQFNGHERMRITPNGNLGVGTSAPEFRVHIKDPIGGAAMGLQRDGKLWSFDLDYQGAQKLYIGHTDLMDVLVLTNQGNIGMGTQHPDAKLTVKGDIHTREVRVDLNGAVAPDYVFEKDYNLLPLPELEAYINQNKHLPEVPSAKEMEVNGLNLKEMNLLLLKKVEELTLHLIEQAKKVVAQDQKIETLNKEIDSFKKSKK